MVVAGVGALGAVVVGFQARGGGVVGGNQARPAMRWNNVKSSFMLRRMCEVISTGVRTDKDFKDVHLNKVAKV